MKTLVIACALLLCLTACATKSPQLIKLSPPAEAVIRCGQIPQIGASDDEGSQWVADMVDQYADCAIRHNKLVEWVEGI